MEGSIVSVEETKVTINADITNLKAQINSMIELTADIYFKDVYSPLEVYP
jgi:hypothetical protein